MELKMNHEGDNMANTEFNVNGISGICEMKASG